MECRIYVSSNGAIIGSNNGLSPNRRHAIIWTKDGILLIGTLGTNFSEIWIQTQQFPYKKMSFEMSSPQWRPLFLGLNVLHDEITVGDLRSTLCTKTPLCVRSGSYIKQMPLEHLSYIKCSTTFPFQFKFKVFMVVVDTIKLLNLNWKGNVVEHFRSYIK